MRYSRHFSIAALSTLLIVLAGPSAAIAQRGVRMSAPIMVRSHAVAGNRGRIRSSVSTLTNLGTGEGIFPGIGLGLGYGFYGTNQSLGIKAVIDPATELQLAVAERFLQNNRGILGTGGYYLLSGGGAYAVPSDEPAPSQEQQQPQVIVLQQAPQQAAQGTPQPDSVAPIPDEGEFTLVFRDGTTVQALAFTRTDARIVYITSDGTRHTIAADQLDCDATVRVNQEHGSSLQLPL